MLSPFEIVAIGFTAFITVDMAKYLRSGELKKDFSSLRTLRGWKWIGAIPVTLVLMFITLSFGLVLMQIGRPIRDWSWLMLLQTPGERVEGQNLMTSGLRIPWFALPFLILLGLNVPRLAKREERAFRQGTRTLPEALGRSVHFGLIHCIVGVPIGIGLALTIPGLWFTYVYLKGGIRLSTAWHVVYNYIILSMAAVWLVSPLFLP
mgnify:FL=1